MCSVLIGNEMTSVGYHKPLNVGLLTPSQDFHDFHELESVRDYAIVAE